MWAGIAHMREHLALTLSDLPADSSPLDRISAAVGAHLRNELDISDYTTASIRNRGQISDQIRSKQVEEEAKYMQIWRVLFREAQEAGQIRPDLDMHVARMFVIGALNWAAEWWSPEERTPLDQVVAECQSLVLFAISSPIAVP